MFKHQKTTLGMVHIGNLVLDEIKPKTTNEINFEKNKIIVKTWNLTQQQGLKV